MSIMNFIPMSYVCHASRRGRSVTSPIILSPETIPPNATATALSTPSKRSSVGGVYLCQNPNWAAPCDYWAHVGCTTFTDNYLASDFSFGPDWGMQCMIYA